MRTGEARAAAEDAARFWIEAGLISFDDGELSASIRQLAEVATAAAAAEAETADEQDEWVKRNRLSPDSWETLALAAGLSPEIATRWARRVADDGSVSELIALAGAIRDGAALDPEILTSVAEAATRRHLAQPDAAERAAEILVSLPLPPDARTRIRPHLSRHVPSERRAVVEAMAILRWDERGPGTDDQLRELVRAPAPPRPGHLVEPADDSALSWILAAQDDLYHATFEAAMVRVANISREDAEAVVARLTDGSINLRRNLENVLRDKGYFDLADRVNADLERGRASWSPSFATDFEDLQRQLMTLVRDLDAPARLSQSRARRLDELADFSSSATLQWIWPGWPERWPHVAAGWIRAVAELAGFDLHVLAAQGQVVLDDIDRGDQTHHVLFDAGQPRDARRWDAVANTGATLEALVDAIGVLPRNASRQLKIAIATAPDSRRASELLEAALHDVRSWARTLTAQILLLTTDRHGNADERARAWLDDRDVWMRQAAAWWWSYRAALAGLVGAEFERCVSDDDEGVRLAALQLLRSDDLSDAVRARVLALRDEERQAWTCERCATVNAAGGDLSCTSCRRGKSDRVRFIDGPDLVRAIDALLRGGSADDPDR